MTRRRDVANVADLIASALADLSEPETVEALEIAIVKALNARGAASARRIAANQVQTLSLDAEYYELRAGLDSST